MFFSTNTKNKAIDTHWDLYYVQTSTNDTARELICIFNQECSMKSDAPYPFVRDVARDVFTLSNNSSIDEIKKHVNKLCYALSCYNSDMSSAAGDIHIDDWNTVSSRYMTIQNKLQAASSDEDFFALLDDVHNFLRTYTIV